MSIKATKPQREAPPRPPETPQCCAVPNENEFKRLQDWRIERYRKMRPDYEPTQCQRASSVEIDGKHYCAPHAGRLALRKWLSGELAELTDTKALVGRAMQNSGGSGDPETIETTLRALRGERVSFVKLPGTCERCGKAANTAAGLCFACTMTRDDADIVAIQAEAHAEAARS